jgi:hypothetical protein
MSKETATHHAQDVVDWRWTLAVVARDCHNDPSELRDTRLGREFVRL